MARHITPGVQVPRAAQRLAVRAAGAGVFAQMVDEDEREAVLALERAELAEERGDFPGRVLIDPMQAHKRVEQEEARVIAVEGGAQPGAIARGIEAEGRCDDQAEVEVAEPEAACGRDGGEARAQVGGRLLGAVEEHRPRLRHGEVAEGRGAARDRDGEIEGEPGLAALRGTPDHADALRAPEALDEPGAPGALARHRGGGEDGQRLDARGVTGHGGAPGGRSRPRACGSSRPRWR